MRQRLIPALLVLFLVIAGAFCILKFREKDPAGDVGKPVTIDEKFTDWRKRIALFEDGSKEHHAILWEVGGDKSLPPDRALGFVLENTSIPGTRIGSVVRIINRAEKTDLTEALRAYELVKGDPKADAMLHSLGSELGREMPEYGLEWLLEQEYSRGIHFAAVNLGKSFAQYAATHPIGEVEPIFIRYLESPLFDGRTYQGGSAEGSRMRERMTQEVLKALALRGKLDEGLASRLATKVPESCVTALDAYRIYSWPLEKVLNDFRIEDFPASSRAEALRVAHGRLLKEATVGQTVAWAGKLDDPNLSTNTKFFTYRHHILKADKKETIQILDNITDPAMLRKVADFAKEQAERAGDEGLSGQIEELLESRR